MIIIIAFQLLSYNLNNWGCTGFKSTSECTNRFEYRKALKAAIPELKNCSYVRETYPPCSKNITVSFSEEAPYVIKTGKSAYGLLPGILEVALDSCCYGCTKVDYIHEDDDIKKLLLKNTSIVIPQEGSGNSDKVFGHDFIQIMEVQQVVFLSKSSKQKDTKLATHLINSVFSTWPLFLISLIMAMTAGCLMWLLDSRFNDEEFPKTFPRGPFEGFWWAFISMTTVGYGDRSPKSVIARLFAIIWILLGITIFSMYTATLTTALNSNIQYSKLDPMFGKKVGVLNFTAAGHAAAVQENADIAYHGSITELVIALNENQIYAMAIDDNIANYYHYEIKSRIPDISVHHKVKVSGNWYGFLSYQRDISIFLRSFFQSNSDNKDSFISHIMDMHQLHLKRHDEPKSALPEYFSHENHMFKYIILMLISFGAATIIIGLSLKWVMTNRKGWMNRLVKCRIFHFKKSEDKRFFLEKYPKSNHQLKNQFIEEIEFFKDRWINLLSEEIKNTNSNI